MRIATIYDIHGNLPALEATLQEIERHNIDLLVVGGDVIAGPMPRETVDLLRNLDVATQFIMGNAEAEYLRCMAGQPIGALSERANEEARWLAQTLSEKDHQFIASWLDTVTIESRYLGRILFCHATPRSNVEVFTTQTAENKLRAIFQNNEASLVICGHTHMQFEHTVEGVRVFNSGSVGMPFGKLGADWLLIDSDVQFMHTDFDREAAVKRINESDYPHANQFSTGNVMTSPSAEQAMQMLAQIEQAQLSIPF